VLQTIVVDLTPVLPGGENGGAKVFVLELLRRLSELAPKTQFVLLTQASAHEELASLDRQNVRRLMVLDNGNARARPSLAMRVGSRVMRHLPGRARSLLGRMLHSLRASMKRSGSRSLLRNLNADLLFCPFTAPTYYDAGVKTVSIIYDLQYKTYPQFFPPEHVAHRDRSFVDAVRRSTMLVAISDYSRNVAIVEGRLDPEQIKTIHLQVSQHSLSNADRDDTILQRLSLTPQRYIIYPANFWRHKNHEMLLTAFGIARRNGLMDDVGLVCTGAPSERQQWLAAAARAMGLEDRIVFPGYLASAELLSLITNSAGVVFPSLYEGFGLPVIEAMASGVPVACSNLTSLPEVVGDAALLFDPRNPEQLSEAIISLVHDRDLTARLVKAGEIRAALFSDSKAMAAQFWRMFEQTVERTAKRSNLLVGVYADGWLGPDAKLEIGPADQRRQLKMDFALPDGIPLKSVTVRLWEDDRLVSELTVRRGQNGQISIPLKETGAAFSITSSPVFIPSLSGGGPDQRALSAQFLRCEFVTFEGENVVLFPESALS
jgi:glycosyltransferase involved in cell wall biosynthesis